MHSGGTVGADRICGFTKGHIAWSCLGSNTFPHEAAPLLIGPLPIFCLNPGLEVVSLWVPCQSEWQRTQSHRRGYRFQRLYFVDSVYLFFLNILVISITQAMHFLESVWLFSLYKELLDIFWMNRINFTFCYM